MRKLLSVLSVLAFLAPQLASADVTLRVGDTYDYPIMYLGRGITASQTNSVFTVPVIRNNAEVTVPASSGAIVQLTRGGLTESIFASRVAVNSTTNVVTFTGTVIRDLCFNAARTYTTCGNGIGWQKGTEIRFVVSNRHLNTFVDRARANSLSASGALTFTQSGSLGLPTFATEADRNQQLGATPGGPVRTACVTATGSCYYYIGGSWIKYGSGSIVNASDTVRGSVQLISASHLTSRTQTGSTGAMNVLTPRWLVKNGTGSTSAYLLPQLDHAGVISTSLGGTGTGGTVATGAVLVTQGKTRPKPIYATSANQVIVSTDGRNWNAGASPMDVDVMTGSIAASNTLTNPQSATYFTQTGTLTTTMMSARGKMFQTFVDLGNIGWGAGNFTVSLKAGSQVIGSCVVTPDANAQGMVVQFFGTIRATGASGIVQVGSFGVMGTGANQKVCAQSTNTTSFDTTANKTLNIGVNFSASNGTNAATMQQFAVWSLTP